MKKISFAIAGATALALAACGGEGDDALGDEYEDAAENKADALEDQADQAEAMGDEATADALEEKADQVEAEGEAMEEAVDEADPVVQ